MQDLEDGTDRRKRQQTEKGKAYEIEKREASCRAVMRKFMKSFNSIQSISLYYENVHRVVEELEGLIALKEEYGTTFNAWWSILVDEDEKTTAQDWFDEQLRKIISFVLGIQDWIVIAKHKIEEQLDGQSHVSSHSSRSSKASSKSSHRSRTSERAKERAKLAELKARSAILERKLAMQNEVERLAIQEEITIAQAREQAYKEIEREEQQVSQSRLLHRTSKKITEKEFEEKVPLLVPRLPLHLQPTPSPTKVLQFSPIARSTDYETVQSTAFKHEESSILTFLDRQNRLTEILTNQHQQSLLPPLSLLKFTNNPMDYSTFMRNFNSQIESRLKSSEACLQYLEQYLEGEAKDLIKGCLHKEADVGYPEAKRLLEERYGDPYKISSAYIKKAKEWPAVKQGDDSALDRFSTFLIQCVCAMESLSYLSILDHPQNLQNLVNKLPFYMKLPCRGRDTAVVAAVTRP